MQTQDQQQDESEAQVTMDDLSELAGPELAEALYERVVARMRSAGVRVATGEFGAMMDVELVNDGPVTLIWDSKD